MSQHTPGPWDVWAMEDGTDGIHATSEGILARVYNTDTNQQAANASLIAKAPEMLAMLQRLVATFVGTGTTEYEDARALLRDFGEEKT